VEKTTEGKTQALKHSAIVTGFNSLGNLSALLADIVIAVKYGLGTETDALFVAFTVPQILASLLLVSFNVTLVPIFSAIKVKQGIDDLWRFSSNLVNISFVVLALVGALGGLSSVFIIPVIAPGLESDTSRLASELSVLLFLMVVPLGAVEVMKAVLNALHSFGPPASAGLLRNSTVMITVLAVSQVWGIRAAAVGYVVGSWLQLLLMSVALFRAGYRHRFVLDLRGQQVRETWGLLRLPLLGGAINLSNVLVERFLVSFLPSGAVSALAYARRILRATDAVFLGSIATAFLPRLSAQLARKDASAYRRYLTLGLRLSLFVAVPMAAGLVALSAPLVRLLFQRGAFDQTAARATATYLSLYMLGIPASAAMQMLVAGFYADHNTVSPFYIQLILLAMNVVLDIALFLLLEAKGLALGLSLARLMAVFIAFFLLRRQVGSFDKGLLHFIVKVTIASLAVIAAVSVVRQVIENQAAVGMLTAVIQLGGGVVVGVIAYALSVVVLRVEEATQIIRLIVHRSDLQSVDSI
jgi:putative peptidoglycan lipid II flippase